MSVPEAMGWDAPRAAVVDAVEHHVSQSRDFCPYTLLGAQPQFLLELLAGAGLIEEG